MSGESGRTALYRIYGEAGTLLYIGITGNVPVRWNAHERRQPWWAELRSLVIELHDSWEEAEAAEEAAIKAERPKYNKRHLPPPQPAGPVRLGRSLGPRSNMSMEELLALPASVPLKTARRVFGFSITTAHRLARAGEFPVRVRLVAPDRYCVSKADIFREVGLEVKVS